MFLFYDTLGPFGHRKEKKVLYMKAIRPFYSPTHVKLKILHVNIHSRFLKKSKKIFVQSISTLPFTFLMLRLHFLLKSVPVVVWVNLEWRTIPLCMVAINGKRFD